MKKTFKILSVSGLAGGFAFIPFGAAQAIEPPPDTATPPPGMFGNAGGNLAPTSRPHLRTVVPITPFLGVSTAPLPDMVADHLGLEKAGGAIIRAVVPGSPAEKAGLTVNDIILKVGQTSVGDPGAISSAVQNLKIGESVLLTLIHKGKQAEVPVTLSERPTDLASESGGNPIPDGLPQAHIDQLRDLIERNLGNPGAMGGMDGSGFEESFRMMRDRMDRAMGGNESSPAPDARGGAEAQQSSTVRVMDPYGSVEIKSHAGETMVTVRDAQNNETWSGPWNTEDDKAAAPEAIRLRIEKVKTNGGAFPLPFLNRDPALPEVDGN